MGQVGEWRFKMPGLSDEQIFGSPTQPRPVTENRLTRVFGGEYDRPDPGRGPCCSPSGAADWRGSPNVRLPIPIAAFRAQGRLGQLSAITGPQLRCTKTAPDQVRRAVVHPTKQVRSVAQKPHMR